MPDLYAVSSSFGFIRPASPFPPASTPASPQGEDQLGKLLWPDISEPSRSAMAKALHLAATAEWYPQYGAALLAVPPPGGAEGEQDGGEPDVRARLLDRDVWLVGLDDWSFTMHRCGCGEAGGTWSFLTLGCSTCATVDDNVERDWAQSTSCSWPLDVLGASPLGLPSTAQMLCF